jgi:hypothetical protein
MPEAPLFLTRRAEIAEMATSMRVPAIYTFREFVQSGGLMSYGSDLPDLYRLTPTGRAAPWRLAGPVYRSLQ